MKNITYVYTGNRKDNFIRNNIFAKEFYYGLTNFNKKHFNIEIIEFERRSGLHIKFLIFLIR